MDIPNSLITIRCHSGMGYGPLIYPSYVSNVLRRVFSGRLEPTAAGNGVDVQPYPEDGEPTMRYRDVSSVEQEIGWLRKVYKGENGMYHVDAVWNPESLKKEFERLLVAEHDRLRQQAKPRAQVAANPTFLAFGLTEDQARALQAAGFMDRASCVGQSLVDLASVPTITIDVAGRLSAAEVKVEAKK
jgi:hypothetical protein